MQNFFKTMFHSEPFVNDFDRRVLKNLGALIGVDLQKKLEPLLVNTSFEMWDKYEIEDEKELSQFLIVACCASATAFGNLKHSNSFNADDFSVFANIILDGLTSELRKAQFVINRSSKDLIFAVENNLINNRIFINPANLISSPLYHELYCEINQLLDKSEIMNDAEVA